MYSYALFAVLGIAVGFLCSILVLHWAIDKPSVKVLKLYFNKRDGFSFTVKQRTILKGVEAEITNKMEVIK